MRKPATPPNLRHMPLRAFHDRFGVNWEVWEAHSTLEERRKAADRRSHPRADGERRDATHTPTRKSLPSEGWLVFRSENARRRYIPIPPAWDRMRDDELEALMFVARLSGPRSRIPE